MRHPWHGDVWHYFSFATHVLRCVVHNCAQISNLLFQVGSRACFSVRVDVCIQCILKYLCLSLRFSLEAFYSCQGIKYAPSPLVWTCWLVMMGFCSGQYVRKHESVVCVASLYFWFITRKCQALCLLLWELFWDHDVVYHRPAFAFGIGVLYWGCLSA